MRQYHFAKIIALATMAFDHYVVVFMQGDDLWRIPGRLAFPLFALLLVDGYQHTSSLRRYTERLILLAIISQWPYSMIFGSQLNILFTLAIALFLIEVVDKKHYLWSLAAAVMLCLGHDQFAIDHGALGLLLPCCLFIARNRPIWSLTALAAFPLLMYLSTGAPEFVWGAPLYPLAYGLYRLPLLPLDRPLRWAYWFYPAHLAALVTIHRVI